MTPDRPVLVFDFGSQFVQLIARRVREKHAFATIVRHDISMDRVRELDPMGIILSGGPMSVFEPNAPHCDPAIFDLGVPVLGLCYGMQLACHLLGGRVEPFPTREFGRAECVVTEPNSDLLIGVPEKTIVWMSHGDQVHSAGPDFLPLARTATCPIAAVKHKDRPVYALQFHPEVAHTPFGSTIIGNFLDRICGSTGSWTMDRFLDRAIEEVRTRVKDDERVVCGVSGGVDSAVVAALLKASS